MPDQVISVLLPSRRRPMPLTDSIASLRITADNAHHLEVLVAADPDDPGTVEAAARSRAAAWVAPERFGYHQLHLYVNELARQAAGDWLLLWNDDARMFTPGWDTKVAHTDPGVLWPRHNGSPHLNVFPLVHKSVFQALGHFSLSPHCDSWIQDVAAQAGIQRPLDAEVLHDRYDLTGGHQDQTWREAQVGYRTADYHSPEMVALRQRDVETIRKGWHG